MDTSAIENARILIVDDEPAIIDLLLAILGEEHNCVSASSAEEANSLLEFETFDLVISDINLGGMNGIELITSIVAKTPDTVVMLISGDVAIERPIEALRGGAFDYIKKPFDIDQVSHSVDRALAHSYQIKAKQRHDDQLEQLILERTNRLNDLAIHDSLTGLNNSASFEGHLSRALHSRKGNDLVAVLLVSFNGLNVIRDRMGQTIGNKLLKEVAQRLGDLAKDELGVARIDGDEFAILSVGRDRGEIGALADEIMGLCGSPLFAGGYEVFLSASVGISVHPEDGPGAEIIFKNAGAALAHARENGGNNYQFYTSEIRENTIRRLVLENDLRHAVEKGELELLYQPKIDVSSKRLTGMEALVRWNHPILGRVSPSDFIHIAEATGTIVPIGEWILREACRQCSIWRTRGFDLEVAVNLSPCQFQQRELLQNILDIISETGLDPSFLNLEVTESAIMSNAESAAVTLRELRNRGIKVSIDDFGTGHSSLSYLKQLPVDVIKIDKSFVNDMTKDQDDASLIMAIITLAHNLKLKVVAEGVETEEQLQFLHLIRCDQWQGYLFSQPVSVSDFEHLLHDHLPASEPDAQHMPKVASSIPVGLRM